MDEQGRKHLPARISDLLVESERGYMTHTAFLDPAEVFFAKGYVKQIGADRRSFFYGGYENAERKCLFILPEYYESLIEDMGDLKAVISVIGDEIAESVRAIRIKGSGYRSLSHRDFLGAILNMGIERSAMGDLCLTEDNTCVVFASSAVADLIMTGCERIGSDKVRLEEIPLSVGFDYKRKTKEINDTVASDRLDCVVSALAGESREKAKVMILSSLVELNYSPSERTDMRVGCGDTVTVRGVGKFIIDNITEETKKGRLRLAARKFI